ncbi:MAG: hypothetical protein HRT88_19985 [Lentisphaeraceae bacterium]|nr:hypothetical protein [Lentisphaeraceae bacterium]
MQVSDPQKMRQYTPLKRQAAQLKEELGALLNNPDFKNKYQQARAFFKKNQATKVLAVKSQSGSSFERKDDRSY